MSNNALLWPSQGTEPEIRLDKYKWLKFPSQGVKDRGPPPAVDKQLVALYPPLADDTYQFYKFYQINSGQAVGLKKIDWFDKSWQKRIELTVNNLQVPSAQTDYPLLIETSFSELANIGSNELRFTDMNNTQLEYQIEDYNILTGDVIIWVKVPLISDGTKIRMYYDNPTAVDEQDSGAVWSNNFIVNQHLNQDDVGNMIDSTIHHNDGVKHNTPTNATGKIGDAKFFGLEDAYVTLDNPTLHTSDITVYCWINIADGNAFHLIASKWFDPNDDDWHFSIKDNDINLQLANNSPIDAGVTVPLSTDILVGFVIRNTTTLEMYLDGVLVHTQTINAKVTSSTSKFQIGDTRNAPIQLQGVIDEFTMSNDGKSADWMKTVYNNQSNPSVFYNVGAEESIPQIENAFPLVIIDTLGAGIFQEPSGNDIRAFDSMGAPLQYEITEMNPVTGEFTIWINVIDIKDSQYIQLTFGKLSATDGQDPVSVWSDYESALHMDPSLVDSTGNHNGIDNGTTDVAGKIGRARNFNGLDYIDLGNFDLTENTLTLSAIVNSSNFVDGVVVGKSDNASHSNPFYKWVLFVTSDERLLCRIDVTMPVTEPNAVPENEFAKIDAVYTGTEIRLFVNGVFQTSLPKTSDIQSSNQKVYIGSRDTTSQAEFFSGIIDEVRIQDRSRSDNAIKTEYNNQINNDEFWFKTPILTNGETNHLVDDQGRNIVAEGN